MFGDKKQPPSLKVCSKGNHLILSDSCIMRSPWDVVSAHGIFENLKITVCETPTLILEHWLHDYHESLGSFFCTRKHVWHDFIPYMICYFKSCCLLWNVCFNIVYVFWTKSCFQESNTTMVVVALTMVMVVWKVVQSFVYYKIVLYTSLSCFWLWP